MPCWHASNATASFRAARCAAFRAGWAACPTRPRYAHKTGSTDNYAADAGIARDERRHYIVALLTSLGRRYAPDERCDTTWRLPALGAAIDALLTKDPA